MGKYNIGDVWWVHFSYSDKEKIKFITSLY